MKKEKLFFISATILLLLLLASCNTRTQSNAKTDMGEESHNVEYVQNNQNNAKITDNGKASAESIVTEERVYHQNTKGFLARPKSEGKYPAVVMIHEWWGLNDNIRDMARQLAAEGYVVLAVDLYEGQSTTDQSKARELVTSVRQNPEPALENLKSAVEFLRERSDVIPEKVASMGWCFGGGMSLQLALTGTPLAATIIYYGTLETDPEKLDAIKQPVLGIFGAKDTSIPVASVVEFNQTLGKIGVPRDIYVYDNVGHAFANPSGPNYAPNETKDAWQKTLDFLENNLKR